jgi:hypothetical protein
MATCIPLDDRRCDEDDSFLQAMPDGGEAVVADAAPVNWDHYWHC